MIDRRRTLTTAEDQEEAARVLEIPASAWLLRRWRGWFAPSLQPFRTDLMSQDVVAAIPDRQVETTAEWCDTFFMYSGTWTWMDEAEFSALRPTHQRSLLAIRRRTVRPKLMPVWPSQLATSGDDVMLRWIASGAVRPSRHRDVDAQVWDGAANLLPGARQYAGTFAAAGSGPNCFGTVLAAVGEPDLPAGRKRFSAWIEGHTDPIEGTSHDHEPGIVFVWTEHGELAHATVTVGDGWMLTKPSQSWSSPRVIWTVRDAVNSWRLRDTRLFRYRIRR